jgi:osmotically-inducible protein OsmY
MNMKMIPLTRHRLNTTALRRTVCQLGIATLMALALTGCSKASPEERLKAVGDDLSDTTTELAGLNAQIDKTETALEQLRDKRRDLRDRVRTLEQRLEVRATDVALFRAVQSALLEDETLRESAIGVSVDEGRVTLTGIVLSTLEARRALNLARQTAGVDDVTSKLRVRDPSTAGSDGS